MKYILINLKDVLLHKFWILFYMSKLCYAIMKRAILHDMSSFSKIELSNFARVKLSRAQLKGVTYGSPEYDAQKEMLGEALKHHYQHNSHHPEYYMSGFKEMTYLDKLEMLCDWRAATRRHADGDLRISIIINRDRYGYTDVDVDLLLLTAREIGLLK